MPVAGTEDGELELALGFPRSHAQLAVHGQRLVEPAVSVLGVAQRPRRDPSPVHIATDEADQGPADAAGAGERL
jgi:hypothetical protein